MLAGVAGLLAGASAMAMGEYVSVSEAYRVAAAVAGLARTRGATHVVIAHRTQTRFERLRHASLAEVLLEALPGVELHVVGPGRRG